MAARHSTVSPNAKQKVHSRFKHGKKNTLVYRVWSRMKERCLSRKNKSYPYYGGRGIKVCERWLDFENFYADMGDPPANHTIERINVNGNYEPSNCRWATWADQYRNRTDSRFLTAFGETKTVADWIEDSRCVVTRSALSKRLQAGWDHQRAISTPMKPDCRRATT